MSDSEYSDKKKSVYDESTDESSEEEDFSLFAAEAEVRDSNILLPPARFVSPPKPKSIAKATMLREATVRHSQC